VIGVPHPVHGEEIRAWIVPRPGTTPDPDEIVGWCRERMAAYKYPRLVELVEELPRTASGKVLRRVLRDR
jgi:long-chain acyl-CoA synthetase